MPKTQQVAENKTENTFPVVCIGMSSGGTAPLKNIFRDLSPATGMAFVIIHHIHTAETLLPEILSNCTMPVRPTSPGMVLRPDHVYVLPSGKEMMAADGVFSVRPRVKAFRLVKCLHRFSELSFSEPPSRNRGGPFWT